MRSYTRHQLKENAFAETTADTISWAVEHRSKLTAAAIVVAIVAAVALGGWAFVNYRNQQASQELADALLKYQAPIRPAGEPASPEALSYASGVERAKAANAEFTRIADKYSFTRNGRIARYFAGITLHDWAITPAPRSNCSKSRAATTRRSAAWPSWPWRRSTRTRARLSRPSTLYKAPDREADDLGGQDDGTIRAGQSVRNQSPAAGGTQALRADAEGLSN